MSKNLIQRKVVDVLFPEILHMLPFLSNTTELKEFNYLNILQHVSVIFFWKEKHGKAVRDRAWWQVNCHLACLLL